MARLLHVFERPGFWVMVAVFGLAFTVTGLYVVNHNAAVKNQQLIAEHRAALEQVCEATQTIGVVLGVFISSGGILENAHPDTAARIAYQRQLNALQVAKIALSETTACRRVTG